MAVQQNKVTRARRGKRRAHDAISTPALSIDPTTGEFYNLEVSPPKDEATASRLIELPEDREAAVKARFQSWNNAVTIIEEAFKS